MFSTFGKILTKKASRNENCNIPYTQCATINNVTAKQTAQGKMLRALLVITVQFACWRDANVIGCQIWPQDPRTLIHRGAKPA